MPPPSSTSATAFSAADLRRLVRLTADAAQPGAALRPSQRDFFVRLAPALPAVAPLLRALLAAATPAARAAARARLAAPARALLPKAKAKAKPAAAAFLQTGGARTLYPASAASTGGAAATSPSLPGYAYAGRDCPDLSS
jgi:hypothetical protein